MKLQINKIILQGIPLERSVSQGFPAIHFLYAICISTITNVLETNFAEISLMETTFKVTNYVDDFAVNINSCYEVNKAFTIFEQFK